MLEEYWHSHKYQEKEVSTLFDTNLFVLIKGMKVFPCLVQQFIGPLGSGKNGCHPHFGEGFVSIDDLLVALRHGPKL